VVDAMTDELAQFVAELVRIPTVNPPGACYLDCAALIAQRYRRFGYDVQLIPATGRTEHSEKLPRVNVLGRLGTGGPVLHFNGHFDVVPPGEGWSQPPFEAKTVGGRIYGRGTSDQKAGLAASLFAVEAIRRSGISLGGTVEQSATVDEESGGFAGVAYLCQSGIIASGQTDYVVITEPLGYDRICLGHRGVYWFEVVARGRTAHGSMPSLGLNAAELMADFVTLVKSELKPSLAGRRTMMPVQPEVARRPSINLNSLHAGQVTDGLETPCVPDQCRAVFDRRFLPEEPVAEVRAEIARLVAKANAVGLGQFDLRDLMVVEPVQTSSDCALAVALAEAIDQVTGRPATFVASPGTYDQKHVVRLARVEQCVAYGPGILELAHQPDEYIEIEHLVQSCKVMAVTALKLLGSTWSDYSPG
jgi:succinyl-diaminopimelate desuccinylase